MLMGGTNFRRSSTAIRHALALLAASWTALPLPVACAQEADLFALLAGNWRGSGTATLFDNRRYHVACDAAYSGTGARLVVRIDCRSDYSDLRLRAQVTRSVGRLTGLWREEVLGVAGTIAGISGAERLSLTVFSVAPAHMDVVYAKRRHRVVITAANVPVVRVEINMRKR